MMETRKHIAAERNRCGVKLKEVMRLLLPTALASALLYIILHEFGHVIVLWFAGADITDFSVLSAHVSYNGGVWTNTSDRWMHLNGALFPLVIATAYMLLYRRNVTNRFYHVFSVFFVLMPIASLLAWVLIPILYMLGQAPEGDDVTKFLYNFCFDHPAYLVSIGSVAVMIGCIYTAVKKGIIENFRMTIKQLKKDNRDNL